jgi:hypothetical protein
MPNSIIYISKAVKLMTEDELALLLKQAYDFNQTKHITGMLLYVEGRFNVEAEGRFIQVLEGKHTVILALLEKIKSDPRHTHLNVVSDEKITKRNFKTWSMGFKSLTYAEFQSIPGYLDLNDYFSSSNNRNSFVKPINYLKSFYQINQQLNTIQQKEA